MRTTLEEYNRRRRASGEGENAKIQACLLAVTSGGGEREGREATHTGKEIQKRTAGENQSRSDADREKKKERKAESGKLFVFPKISVVGFYGDPATSTGRSGNPLLCEEAPGISLGGAIASRACNSRVFLCCYICLAFASAIVLFIRAIEGKWVVSMARRLPQAATRLELS